MKKAFITGISGHIGAHLARLLQKEGWSVTGLARRTSNLNRIKDFGVDVQHGDISDKESIRKGLAGCEALFHLAAPTTVRTEQDKEAVFAGVRNMCHLMLECGVKRMVYVSSTVTVGVVDSKNKTFDEASETKLSGTKYQEVKWEAEQYVKNFVKEKRADVVIVNPSTIIGSGDTRPTPPNQLIVDFLNYAGSWAWIKDKNLKAAPVWFDTGFSLVDAEDVAQGIYRAFQKGKRGERYILGGDNIEMREMYRALSRITGLPAPWIYLPKPCMLALSWIFTKLMEHPPMSYSLAKTMVGKYAFFSSEKAKQELGYSRRSYQETLLRAVEWFLTTTLIVDERKKEIIKSRR